MALLRDLFNLLYYQRVSGDFKKPCNIIYLNTRYYWRANVDFKELTRDYGSAISFV